MEHQYKKGQPVELVATGEIVSFHDYETDAVLPETAWLNFGSGINIAAELRLFHLTAFQPYPPPKPEWETELKVGDLVKRPPHLRGNSVVQPSFLAIVSGVFPNGTLELIDLRDGETSIILPDENLLRAAPQDVLDWGRSNIDTMKRLWQT